MLEDKLHQLYGAPDNGQSLSEILESKISIRNHIAALNMAWKQRTMRVATGDDNSCSAGG